MTKDMQVFNFETNPVRVIQDEKYNPWWVAKDVCDVLDLSDHIQAVDKLDDDERGRYKIPTPGGNQEMIIVNEPGFYTLIFRSNKPEAKKFKRWIAHDVLPSIRKTGGYTANRDSQVNVSMVGVRYTAAIKLAKQSGLTGNMAIQAGNDIVLNELGVSPLQMCGVKLEDMEQDYKYKAAIKSLRIAGKNGIKPGDMSKTHPWDMWTKKERFDVLDRLFNDGVAVKMKVKTGKRGPESVVWALK